MVRCICMVIIIITSSSSSSGGGGSSSSSASSSIFTYSCMFRKWPYVIEPCKLSK